MTVASSWAQPDSLDSFVLGFLEEVSEAETFNWLRLCLLKYKTVLLLQIAHSIHLTLGSCNLQNILITLGEMYVV